MAHVVVRLLGVVLGAFPYIYALLFLIHPTHRFHGENPPGAFARKTADHVGRASSAERGDCVASLAGLVDHVSDNSPMDVA